MLKQPSTHGRSDAAGFAATRWTIVLAAAGGDVSSDASQAMAELCRVYWFPLYAYVRRRGYDTHEAEDLTQEFFLRVLAKNYLAGVDRQKGKFRAFLLASLQHFLANEWDRAQAQKRGGGKKGTVPICAQHPPGRSGKWGLSPFSPCDAESRYCLEPAHNLTPERLFERQWALTVLERVLARLQAEAFALNGEPATFNLLKQFLTGSGASSGYAQVAAELGKTEGAVKVAVYRLRRRYRNLLQEEIAQTVASPEEIDDEIRYLLGCL